MNSYYGRLLAMQIRHSLVVLALVLSASITPLSAQPSSWRYYQELEFTTSAFPLEITGSNGEIVVLEKPPERIIAFDSGAAEILFALGEGARIVAAHQYLSFPPETKIEKVGNAFNINFEKIASLRPDLVVIFFDRFLPSLKRLHVPVLYLKPPSTLGEVTARMRLWGRIVAKSDAGESMAQTFQSKLRNLRAKLGKIRKGPTVFHDAAPGLWTLGRESLADDIYTFLKAENAFADLAGAQQVSPEAIVARKPEVIISVYAEGPKYFREHPAFQNLEAVRKGRLFWVDSSLFSVAGPRLITGIKQLAKALYPHCFGEASC